jgi:hypothetical protein
MRDLSKAIKTEEMERVFQIIHDGVPEIKNGAPFPQSKYVDC